MAAETGFTIDGQNYEIPSLDTFTMDEAQVLYDYSGLTIEDFASADGDDEDSGSLDPKFKNPGLLRALLHVAYQRGNPKTNPSRVKTLIGSASLMHTIEALADTEEDDAGPPASTTEPNESSPRSSVGSNENSGEPSPEDTAGQVVPLSPTTPGSTLRSESAPSISAF